MIPSGDEVWKHGPLRPPKGRSARDRACAGGKMQSTLHISSFKHGKASEKIERHCWFHVHGVRLSAVLEVICMNCAPQLHKPCHCRYEFPYGVRGLLPLKAGPLPQDLSTCGNVLVQHRAFCLRRFEGCTKSMPAAGHRWPHAYLPEKNRKVTKIPHNAFSRFVPNAF